MLSLDFFWGQQLFPVARVSRCDLRSSRSIQSLLAEMVFDLLTAQAGRFQILAGVAFDLRLAILAALNLIAQTLQSRGQLSAIDGRGIVLRGIQLTRL